MDQRYSNKKSHHIGDVTAGCHKCREDNIAALPCYQHIGMEMVSETAGDMCECASSYQVTHTKLFYLKNISKNNIIFS